MNVCGGCVCRTNGTLQCPCVWTNSGLRTNTKHASTLHIYIYNNHIVVTCLVLSNLPMIIPHSPIYKGDSIFLLTWRDDAL